MTSPKIILDTNIVSYSMKGANEAKRYTSHLAGKLLAITFVTVGELYYGAEKARWGEARRKRLEETLRNFVVVPYDYEIARCYGRVRASIEAKGRPVSDNDLWMAACAIRHGTPLVTHNAKHFVDIPDLAVVTEAP